MTNTPPEKTGDAIVDRERRLAWSKERAEDATNEVAQETAQQNAETEGVTQEMVLGIQIRKWAFETAMESLPDNTLDDILLAADAISTFVLMAELPDAALEPETGAGEPTEGAPLPPLPPQLAPDEMGG